MKDPFGVDKSNSINNLLDDGFNLLLINLILFAGDILL